MVFTIKRTYTWMFMIFRHSIFVNHYIQYLNRWEGIEKSITFNGIHHIIHFCYICKIIKTPLNILNHLCSAVRWIIRKVIKQRTYFRSSLNIKRIFEYACFPTRISPIRFSAIADTLFYCIPGYMFIILRIKSRVSPSYI